MGNFADQHCEACRADAPVVTSEQLEELMANVPEWQVYAIDGILRLSRTFKFSNFVDALAFTNHVGEIAELEGHHPEIVTEWGRVKVTWWTHKIKGLHLNDFIVAARCDRL